MNYLTKSEYFKLIKKKKMLEIQGLSLKNNAESEYHKLLEYEIILEKKIFYDNRSQYIHLIKNYIDGEINCYAFQWDFFELYQNHLAISDNLIENFNQSSSITFYTDSKVEHFSSLINEIVGLCEFLDEGVTPEKFDKEIKKIYNNMQKYVLTTSSIYYNTERKYEELISSSFKFLEINLGLSILLLLSRH